MTQLMTSSCTSKALTANGCKFAGVCTDLVHPRGGPSPPRRFAQATANWQPRQRLAFYLPTVAKLARRLLARYSSLRATVPCFGASPRPAARPAAGLPPSGGTVLRPETPLRGRRRRLASPRGWLRLASPLTPCWCFPQPGGGACQRLFIGGVPPGGMLEPPYLSCRFCFAPAGCPPGGGRLASREAGPSPLEQPGP